MPKGGWHGEAVTGGFFFRTHGRAHGPCPTRCCVIGPGRTGSSAPTSISIGGDTYIAPPYRTSCYANASGGVLSVTSDRKYPKNAAKTNGFGILARAWCGMYRGLLSPRIKQYKSVPCFRIVSGSIHRDALRACAARPNRAALCVYRTARCGHRALRSSIGKSSVGADAYIGPFCRTSCNPSVGRRALTPPEGCGGLSGGAMWASRPTQAFQHFRRGGRLCPPARKALLVKLRRGDPCGRPRGLHRISYNVSLRDQFANWSWQSVPSAPLPKEGCRPGDSAGRRTSGAGASLLSYLSYPIFRKKQGFPCEFFVIGATSAFFLLPNAPTCSKITLLTVLRVKLRSRSCAMDAHESCQAGNRAALRGIIHVPQGRRLCGFMGRTIYFR